MLSELGFVRNLLRLRPEDRFHLEKQYRMKLPVALWSNNVVGPVAKEDCKA